MYTVTMTRPLRLEFPSALFHKTSRRNRRENIFEDDEVQLWFLEILESALVDYNWLWSSNLKEQIYSGMKLYICKVE